jgi:hypothetical protein
VALGTKYAGQYIKKTVRSIQMKKLMIAVICMISGLATGLYFSHHVTDLLPDAASSMIKDNKTIIMGKK